MAPKPDRRDGEAAPTLVYVDTDLRVRFASRHCHEILGHAPDALHGRELGDLVDTATLRFARLHVADVERGAAGRREYALRRKDGSKMLVQVSAVADRDSAGRSVGYVLRTEPDSPQRFSLPLEGAAASFWVWDLLTRSEHYSRGFKDLLGYAETDFPPQFRFFAAIHPDDRGATADAVAAAIRDGRRFDREFRLRACDGGWRWIRGIAQTEPDADGTPGTRFQGVAHDISRRKRTELELRDAEAAVRTALDRCTALARDLGQRNRLDRVRGELLAAANHALRTPLASIIAALELLQDDSLPASAGTPESLLAIALENAGRLAMVVEQWLDMERIDIGAALLRSVPLGLETIIAGAVDQLGAPRAAKVRVERATGNRPRVNADPARLQQALSHLIGVAVDRSPAGCTVAIRLRMADGRVVVSIEDEAPHAPPGGDLGLLVAEAIAKRCQGALRVEPHAKGTLIVLELPCLKEDAHA
jgi:PAS domain S-box-containing protein